jgi:hypothetical protein
MPITSDHKDLFHKPTTDDKLNLFQLLMDTNELSVSLTLALMKIIHRELKNNENDDRSVYKRYAETIEALRYHMLDTLQLAVATWKNNQSTAPAEWFSDGGNTKE